ncbi:MAG: OmpH family outer membrane protein [Brevinematales bacterium]|nr:OmpH family outer membrane protein [Brevinematales bacterium]
MKKTIFSLMAIMFLASGGFAADENKRLVLIGFVDVEEVVKFYPGIEDVKQKIKVEKDKYQVQINKLKEEIAIMEQNYQQNFNSMTDEEKERREAEIQYKKETLYEYIDDANKKLDALKEELTGPIYAKISAIIERVSKEKGYSFVFKKSSKDILYVDKEFDLTPDVIERLKKELQLEDRD